MYNAAISGWNDGVFRFRKVLNTKNNPSFEEQELYEEGNRDVLMERRNASTNDIGQWCLNIIMCLELISGSFPETVEQAVKLIEESRQEYRNDY